MLLYEPVDNKKVFISYTLNDIVQSKRREEIGITDNYAVMSLSKIISGGIKSIHELHAAEQCLRALIFHERIICQSPSIKINNIFNHVIALDNAPISVTTFLEQDIIQFCIGNINSLLGFNHIGEAHIEINRRNEKRIKNEQLYKSLNLQEAITFEFSPDYCQLISVAGNLDEYAHSCFSNDLVLQSRYLLPIISTKIPSYMSYPCLIKNFDNASAVNTEKAFKANEFFHTIDDIWKTYCNRLRHRIEIPMPVFLSIVLDRAQNRQDIGKAITELREEYSSCRSGLWSIYEQLDDTSICDNRYVQILTDVEESTKEIFTNSLLPSSKSKSLLTLDNQKRFFSLLTSGCALFDGGLSTQIIAFINGVLGGLTVGNTFDLRAARITAQNLKDLENSRLLTKFFSDEELHNLRASLN